MNNYYLLIYLTNELNNKLLAAVLDKVITPYKDTIEFYFTKEDEEFRLIFSTNPNSNCLFLDQYRPAKKSNTISFFEDLKDARVKSMDLTENDRFVTIHFDNNKQLIFKIFGHKSNVLLANNNEVIDAFKQKEKEIGKAIPEPKHIDFFTVKDATVGTKQKITQLNPILPRTILDKLISEHELESSSNTELEAFIREVTYEISSSSEFRVLDDYEITPLSEEILPGHSLKSFKSVNEAIRFAYRNKSKDSRISDVISSYLNNINRKLKREKNTLKNLYKAANNPERGDELEKMGHLLMASAHRIKVGEEIEVEDFYSDNEIIKIPLKQGKSIAENAELYYAKSRNAKESYAQSVGKIPLVESQIELLESMKKELQKVEDFKLLDTWKSHYSDQIQLDELGTYEQTKSDPYKKTFFESFEIWIGKHAKSNDKIVQLSHKEDIWLHARGVGGSHVVIRNRNNKELPPKRVIEKAASYAAYYSKLKGSDLVPVIYTKRKFIRKPKGGAAGLVKVDKEEVVIVEPEKPENG